MWIQRPSHLFTGLVLIASLYAAMTSSAADRPPGGPAVARPATPATQPAAADAIVGDWRVRVAPHTAVYHFDRDGTFTLTFFGPQGGVASGNWKLDRDTLVLENKASSTPLTHVGEQETARVTEVTADTLTVRGTDAAGREDGYVFRRAAPFAAGKKDNPRVVGSWRGMNQDVVLVLAEDGTAVVYDGRREPSTGQWSQHGKSLNLRLAGNPRGAARKPGGPTTKAATTKGWEKWPSPSSPSMRPRSPSGAKGTARKALSDPGGGKNCSSSSGWAAPAAVPAKALTTSRPRDRRSTGDAVRYRLSALGCCVAGWGRTNFGSLFGSEQAVGRPMSGCLG